MNSDVYAPSLRPSERSSEATRDMVQIHSAGSANGDVGQWSRQKLPSQKLMLSKALQKANTAVLLDNAANFEGAIEAYGDACHLLQTVMLRSSGPDDEKVKLQEIRDTYLVRIHELQSLNLPFQSSIGKALPERPLSEASLSIDTAASFDDESENDTLTDSTPLRTNNDSSPDKNGLNSSSLSDRRQHVLLSLDTGHGRPVLEEEAVSEHLGSASWATRTSSLDIHPKDSINRDIAFTGPGVPLPMSPTSRLFSFTDDFDVMGVPLELEGPGLDDPTTESTSWLDTINESPPSPSSIPFNQSIYLRRHSRPASIGTEAEFDAALDAAVEAAYDQGLEPATDGSQNYLENDIVANVRRNIEIAKQRVREAELEAQAALARTERRPIVDDAYPMHLDNLQGDYVDEEAEEEERLLEEMTQGYVMDDFEFDLHSKSALPRQSDSSTFSGKTWGSSVTSNITTAGTSLTTLAEDAVLPPLLDASIPNTRVPIPPQPPPIHAPPGPPLQLPQSSISSPHFTSPAPSSVRARRLSGQNAKQLKIETGRPPVAVKQPDDDYSAEVDQKTSFPPISSTVQNSVTRTTTKNSSGQDSSAESPSRHLLNSAVSEPPFLLDQEDSGRSNAPSPSRPTINKATSAPGNLREHTSSSSLRALRLRNMSVSTPDIAADSPQTPLSTTFPTQDIYKGFTGGTVPFLPTPIAHTFAISAGGAGGLYLFDSNIHSPTTPGSPNSAAANHPIPLEPCPESFLLRPFWLMRCLYQTLAHPRGGYLTTKLFIPRDIWRVRNVKIKGIDEKVSVCDLLTAALLKLAQVDTYDADAVLEEMQSFENILDQAQMSLTKKLGSEVGVQGTMGLFKSNTGSEEAISLADTSQKNSAGSGKSRLSSWRKLRSKSGTANTNLLPKDGPKENRTLASLPMTGTPGARVTRRNALQLQFSGHYANYMGALARLFDAVQVLDQVARQVEDPGLKHSSPTHVGLELSTRHAAEFFGFYICRFALNDIGLLLDKFIKRGTEWVML